MEVFEGEPPTTWTEATAAEHPTDEGACAVALLAAQVNVFTNASARRALASIGKPTTRPDIRAYPPKEGP